MERGLAQIALILSEQSRVGLYNKPLTLRMSVYFLRFSPSSEHDGIFFVALFSQADNSATI
jgi:hypothetical protein